jgi:hypothetical protein
MSAAPIAETPYARGLAGEPIYDTPQCSLEVTGWASSAHEFVHDLVILVLNGQLKESLTK